MDALRSPLASRAGWSSPRLVSSSGLRSLLVPLVLGLCGAPCATASPPPIFAGGGEWAAPVTSVGPDGSYASTGSEVPDASDSPWDTTKLLGLRAGTASSRLDFSSGVPLGGYGNLPRRRVLPHLVDRFPLATWFRPSTGTLTPLNARAFLLEDGRGRRLLFLGLDLIAVSRAFRNDLLDRVRPLGFERDEVHVFATHTHSGPGGLADNPFWEIAATDRFQPALYARIVEGSVGVVHDALASLEPASLEETSFPTTDLQVNRRTPGGAVDTTARLLLARRKQGEGYVGGLLNYAMHGTVLRPENLSLSADAPGILAETTADVLWDRSGRRGPRPGIVFLAGQEGDVNPKARGPEGLPTLASGFSTDLSRGLARCTPVWPAWKVESAEVDLGTARIRARNCTLGTDLDFLSKILPRVPVGSFFPRTAEVTRIGIGHLRLSLWPGEPTTRMGVASKGERTKEWIVSLANDYLAYFTAPDEYDRGGYESCMSLFGPDGGTRIAGALRALATGIQ